MQAEENKEPQQVQQLGTMKALFAANNELSKPSSDTLKRHDTTTGLDKEEAKVVIEAPVLPPSTQEQLNVANRREKNDIVSASIDSQQVEQMIAKIKHEAISDRSSGQGVDGAKS